VSDEGKRCPPAAFFPVRFSSFNADCCAFHRALRRCFADNHVSCVGDWWRLCSLRPRQDSHHYISQSSHCPVPSCYLEHRAADSTQIFFPLIKQVPPMSPRRLSFIPCLSIPAFTGYMLPSYLCISRSTIGMFNRYVGEELLGRRLVATKWLPFQ